MTTSQQIRIHELLLEREALFARIHACEREASRLLGEPYPFVRPVLPSDQKARKKSGAARNAASGSAGRDPLRRLEPGERRYRVTYRSLGREMREEHEELDSLRLLMACQTEQTRVLTIETLDAAGARIALLFGQESTEAS